mmetsp:Transcript_112998/g.364835  ORF Transcript_112998/g.364835 Transcript_112998/m.364835 type:complete len:214 (-) Transcript_112998:118-759(-)
MASFVKRLSDSTPGPFRRPFRLPACEARGPALAAAGCSAGAAPSLPAPSATPCASSARLPSLAFFPEPRSRAPRPPPEAPAPAAAPSCAASAPSCLVALPPRSRAAEPCLAALRPRSLTTSPGSAATSPGSAASPLLAARLRLFFAGRSSSPSAADSPKEKASPLSNSATAASASARDASKVEAPAPEPASPLFCRSSYLWKRLYLLIVRFRW